MADIALLPKDARHHETLMDFLNYCHDHPELRFWQALRAWSGYNKILAQDVYQSQGYPSGVDRDTFYWEGKRHDD